MANFLADAIRKYNVGGLQDYQSRTPKQQDLADVQAMQARRDPEANQNQVGAAEHQEFARYLAANLGPLGYAMDMAAVPLYEVAKMTGMMGGRSEPSLQSAASGYQGANEGLADWWKRL